MAKKLDDLPEFGPSKRLRTVPTLWDRLAHFERSVQRAEDAVLSRSTSDIFAHRFEYTERLKTVYTLQLDLKNWPRPSLQVATWRVRLQAMEAVINFGNACGLERGSHEQSIMFANVRNLLLAVRRQQRATPSNAIKARITTILTGGFELLQGHTLDAPTMPRRRPSEISELADIAYRALGMELFGKPYTA